MTSGRFRAQYDLLVKQLRRQKKMTLAELCMLWNVGPDRAKRLIKSMSKIDRHIKISKDEVEWEDEPYKDLLPDLGSEESEEAGLENGNDSEVGEEKWDDRESELFGNWPLRAGERVREGEKS